MSFRFGLTVPYCSLLANVFRVVWHVCLQWLTHIMPPNHCTCHISLPGLSAARHFLSVTNQCSSLWHIFLSVTCRKKKVCRYVFYDISVNVGRRVMMFSDLKRLSKDKCNCRKRITFSVPKKCENANRSYYPCFLISHKGYWYLACSFSEVIEYGIVFWSNGFWLSLVLWCLCSHLSAFPNIMRLFVIFFGHVRSVLISLKSVLERNAI